MNPKNLERRKEQLVHDAVMNFIEAMEIPRHWQKEYYKEATDEMEIFLYENKERIQEFLR